MGRGEPPCNTFCSSLISQRAAFLCSWLRGTTHWGSVPSNNSYLWLRYSCTKIPLALQTFITKISLNKNARSYWTHMNQLWLIWLIVSLFDPISSCPCLPCRLLLRAGLVGVRHDVFTSLPSVFLKKLMVHQGLFSWRLFREYFRWAGVLTMKKSYFMLPGDYFLALRFLNMAGFRGDNSSWPAGFVFLITSWTLLCLIVCPWHLCACQRVSPERSLRG